MKSFSRSALILSLGAALSLGSVAEAAAATWANDHPRRVELNKRLANQNKRIDADLASGKITAAQAARLHSEDATARTDERFDASFDKSHLTKADQTSLNQDENGISKQISQDAH